MILVHLTKATGFRFSLLTEQIPDAEFNPELAETAANGIDRDELVERLEELLSDRPLREELGAKAEARSREFSWPQSAAAMRTVLESVHTGGRVSGVVQP